jgi:hypothetical protein
MKWMEQAACMGMIKNVYEETSTGRFKCRGENIQRLSDTVP